jgi:class 3 adenylate cyclase
MHQPVAHQYYNGAVLFFAVHDIKQYAPNLVTACIIELNRVVSQSALIQTIGRDWVGTTVSGLFVLVPDGANIVAHEHLARIAADCAKCGIPVKCAVAYGRVVCVEDTDCALNFIGTAINTAARLTFADENGGCLVAERYVQYAKEFSSHRDEGLLERSSVISVSGKAHDADFLCRKISRPDVSMLSEVNEGRLTAHKSVSEIPGLVIAYDLPQFSAGDESQIDKRVRSLVSAFHRLRQNRTALRNSKMYFCPGGDGGILVLENVLEEADEIATSLSKEFLVESEYKEDSISVEARIGVHYGVVLLYHDVRGALRPTGRTCFATEELTSDKYGKAAGLVFSGALKDVISRGSEKTLTREFEELPALPMGPAAELRRFARRASPKAQFSHPLIEQLFGPTSSWQVLRK